MQREVAKGARSSVKGRLGGIGLERQGEAGSLIWARSLPHQAPAPRDTELLAAGVEVAPRA